MFITSITCINFDVKIETFPDMVVNYCDSEDIIYSDLVMIDNINSFTIEQMNILLSKIFEKNKYCVLYDKYLDKSFKSFKLNSLNILDLNCKILFYDEFYIVEKGNTLFNISLNSNWINGLLFNNGIFFDKMKLEYRNDDILITNASIDDLIQLSFILKKLKFNKAIAIGNYKFIPGWKNEPDGNLIFMN